MNPRNHLGAAGASAIGLTTAGYVEVGDSGTSGLSRRLSSGLGGDDHSGPLTGETADSYIGDGRTPAVGAFLDGEPPSQARLGARNPQAPSWNGPKRGPSTSRPTSA